MTDLGAILQSCVDERARRHAVSAERLNPGPARQVHEARMEEALEIGRYIARMRGEKVDG